MKSDSEGEISKSINLWNKRSYEDYKDWILKAVKNNQETSIFLKNHIENFMSQYKKRIGLEGNFLLKKLFFIHLEFKEYKEAKILLLDFIKELGKEKSLLRMYGEESEVDPKGSDVILKQYKSMILNDQNDSISTKKYIYYLRMSVDLNNKQSINDYIDLWNLYLEVYMNDPEAFNELSQIYLAANEYDKAAFCLEELLLNQPRDYKVMNKLGDIYASQNTTEGAKTALKFYAQGININPTPRGFFGIQQCISIIKKGNKKLDEKTKQLLDITKKELQEIYKETPFSGMDLNKIFGV